MRLGDESIRELQSLLKTEFGLDYTAEQAQQAGISIMRFIVSKHRRNQLFNKEKENVIYNTKEVKSATQSNKLPSGT